MKGPVVSRFRVIALAAVLGWGAPPAWSAREESPQETLYRAAGRGELEAVKAALARGADPRGSVNVGRTALHGAAERGHLETVRLLLERGADPSAVSELGETPLLLAVESGKAELVKLLLAKGAKADQVNKRGETQLHVAARKGWRAAVAFLLDRGAEVDAPDKYDVTPLLAAASIGRSRDDYETVKLLIERGADPKAKGHTKGTALHEASGARGADPRLLELLISRGVDVNSQESGGETPLMRAAFHGHDRTLKALLAQRADPNREDISGQTALDVAEERGHQEVIALLKEAGARPGSGVSKYAKAAAKRDAGRASAPAAETAPPAPSDVDRPSYKLPESPDNFALIVGIQRYGGLPEASFAERDARAMRSHLVAMGYPERNIISLIGADASRAGLAKNLETKLPRLVNERSTVLFYYSGHGAPDPVTGEAYLVPVDGDPEFLKDTAYPLAQLHKGLGRLKARKVLAVVDACFSGVGGRSVLPKGTRPLVTKVKTGLSGSDKLVFMSASDDHQISGTAEEQGHGLFTYYFLKGLNGDAARSGKVTAQGVYDYLKPKVMDEASRHNRDQVPQLLPRTGEAAALRLR